MHELSIASSIVDIILDNIAGYPKSVVRSVTVDLGEMSGVEPEALSFCFPMACEDKRLKSAIFKLNIIPLTISCNACHAKDLVTKSLQCPLCGSSAVTITAGKDMIVASIDVDV